MTIDIIELAREAGSKSLSHEPYECDNDALQRFAAELRRLHEVNRVLVEALERLARLGNEPHYGNSKGNIIAIAALAKAGEA